MANTLSISVTLSGLISGQAFPIAATANTAPAGTGAIKETLSITTSATQIPLSGITQAGYVVITNLDAANAVDISFENTGAVTPQTIQPGGVLVLSPASSAVVYGKAHTATVQIAYCAITI